MNFNINNSRKLFQHHFSRLLFMIYCLEQLQQFYDEIPKEEYHIKTNEQCFLMESFALFTCFFLKHFYEVMG